MIPFEPPLIRCGCERPPTDGAWCTVCGGRSFNPQVITDKFFGDDEIVIPVSNFEKTATDNLRKMEQQLKLDCDFNLTAAKQFSLQPQDIVEEYRRKWAKIWLRFDGVASAPWRGLGDLRDSFHWLPRKRKLNADDIWRAGNCFKVKTGRGAEDFHPRWFAYLPESARAEFAELLNRLEELGC